jgi:hypothetical protein
MRLSDFRSAITAAGDSRVEFALPDGSKVPAHYHVTEVGYVTKDFFDCGGTRRRDEYCSLQLWVANDTEHGLIASRIEGIFKHTAGVIANTDVAVMVEYQRESITRYAVESVTRVFGKLVISLAPVFTDCLAPDRCGVDGSCC